MVCLCKRFQTDVGERQRQVKIRVGLHNAHSYRKPACTKTVRAHGAEAQR